ncbi:MAG TPA: hypothetical protein VHW60_14200 [Caulobacteraceae bacterium]|nr:hypothetical protein [Caulobacteraceae bacterium]
MRDKLFTCHPFARWHTNQPNRLTIKYHVHFDARRQSSESADFRWYGDLPFGGNPHLEQPHSDGRNGPSIEWRSMIPIGSPRQGPPPAAAKRRRRAPSLTRRAD